MDKTIGIDFGATNASVAIWERNEAQVLADGEGCPGTPAVVAQMPDGRRLVGQVVQRQMVIHADTSIDRLQSWLGRRFSHPQTAADSAEAAYGVAASPRGDAWVELCGHAVPPAELAATLLAYLRELARDYTGVSADTAVVAVPASFHAAARRALLDAGELAEFSAVHLISSSAAAAVAYARTLPPDVEPHPLAIFDWGGGACHVAIANVCPSSIEVLTTVTDHGCGGHQVDVCVAEHLVGEFATQERIDLRDDAIGWQRVLQAAPEVKRILSEESAYELNLPFIAADADGAKHLAITVTRDMFEQLAAPWVKRCRALCERALEEAGLDAKGIGATLLVGGMTHIPLVKTMVKKAFGKKPVVQEGLQPQQVVATGAVLRAAMLKDEISKISVLDGLGAEIAIAAGAQRVVLWPRGAALPAEAQVCVEVPRGAEEEIWEVLQDDDGHCVARIDLPGMGPGEIEIKATLDAEGLVDLEVQDARCRPARSAEVELFGPLTPAEIDQIFARARARREEGSGLGDAIEVLRGRAEDLVVNTENALEVRARELTQVDLADITGALNNLKQALESADPGAIENSYAVLHASARVIDSAEHASTS